MRYYAHSGSQSDLGDGQPLREHLREVARHAEQFARQARPDDDLFAEAARSVGLLHDVGKYRIEFQQMLMGLRPPREKTYHKQAGAAKAALARNNPVAFAIAGHHGGIPNLADLKGAIAGPSGSAVLKAVWDDATHDCPELHGLSLPPSRCKTRQPPTFSRGSSSVV